MIVKYFIDKYRVGNYNHSTNSYTVMQSFMQTAMPEPK